MSLVNKDRRFCFKKMSILFILLFSLLTVNTSFSQTNNFIKENRLPSLDEEKEFISKYGRPSKVVNDPVKITVLYDNYLFTEGTRTNWGFSCLIEGTEKTINI